LTPVVAERTAKERAESRAAPDIPPAKRLGLVPKIASDEDFEDCGRELSYLDSLETTRSTSAKMRIDLIAVELADSLVTTVEHVEVSFADRRMALEEAAKKYLTKFRAQLVKPGTKSYEGNFLEASWKDGQLSVSPIDGAKDADVVNEISVRTRIATAIKKLVDGARLFRRPLNKFIRTKVELNKSGILEAYSNQDVTDDQLKEIKVQVKRGEEKLTLTVKPYKLESVSEEKRVKGTGNREQGTAAAK
jgi:hypothetical protein